MIARVLPVAAVLLLLVHAPIVAGLAADPGRDAGPPRDAVFDLPLPEHADDGPVRTVVAWIDPGAVGRPDMLNVAVLVHQDWWVHSLRQRGGGTEGKRTRIAVAPDSPRQVAGDFEPLADPVGMLWPDCPEWANVIFECHRGLVVWQAPLAADGPMEVRGTITVQADCDYACAAPETHAFVATPLAPAD